MYGKIAISITGVFLIGLPLIYLILYFLSNVGPFKGMEYKEILYRIKINILIMPLYLTPLVAISIIVLGYLSNKYNEGYGFWLKACVYISYTYISIITVILLLIVYLYSQKGGRFFG